MSGDLTRRAVELAEFILARIAEDEARGGSMREIPQGDTGWGELLFEMGHPRRIWATSVHPRKDVTEQYNAWVKTLPLSKSAKRVLAECEAKRQIVKQCVRAIEKYDGERIVELAWDTLIDLAQVDADHPDFREEWRVDA